MIINILASLINDFIENLYNSGIKFYIILIGLFIFNFIIFIICRIIKLAKSPNYKDLIRR